MRWCGLLYGSNILSKNGRGVSKLIQNQDLKHMQQSKKMCGRSLGKRPKRGLEST